MITIVLQVMWTAMAVLLTKNYYDNSSYRWAVINAGVSGAMVLLTILEVLTTCFGVVLK